MKKRVVIIGGAGFIGHNLAISLKRDGHKVTVIDGLNVNNLLNFNDKKKTHQNLYMGILNQRFEILRNNKINFQIQDARDYHALSKLINTAKPDVVVHLAAVSHSNKSNKDPHSTFDHSLRTLENAMDSVRESKAHFIYFSSSMVYGNFNSKKVKEDSVLNPMGIYGTLKLCGEHMVKSYNQVFDMPYTIIRPSALYGERCVSGRVSQLFIENILKGDEIVINGDGKEKLDFTYIEDLIQGIKLCITKKQAINQTFNITYGKGQSVIKLVNILSKYFPKIKIKYKKRDKLMPVRGSLDISNAKKLLKYNPKYPLDSGYPKYIEWYLNFAKKL